MEPKFSGSAAGGREALSGFGLSQFWAPLHHQNLNNYVEDIMKAVAPGLGRAASQVAMYFPSF